MVREFAQVDSSIAHIFSYHHLGVIVPHLFGTIEQKEYYYKETIRQNWFWANALNPLDRRTAIASEGDIFRLEGKKSVCSGSWDSDILPVTAIDQETGKISVLVVPTQREGVELHADWDNMGQRQTDSGSVSFHNVAMITNYPSKNSISKVVNSLPYRDFVLFFTNKGL
ncbi:acyl-CoA dehydrogenase family protein [Microcystis sp. M025S2]|uniref:acyl-CoA dehydrogenase family protein n=1 Tax=Microcystis sp. M025S2 TaxID=2771161 RepID=UPI0025840581|nr:MULTISPECIES: acyl-CoA dehydrogenase family protein [unclassified Microcystis]